MKPEIVVAAAIVAGVNVATFALYGYDKLAAIRSWRRVPEATLHLFALLGGSPAGILARGLFRHKTIKPSFRRMSWLIVALQVAAIGAGVWFFRLR